MRESIEPVEPQSFNEIIKTITDAVLLPQQDVDGENSSGFWRLVAANLAQDGQLRLSTIFVFYAY
jgi:hypothetical protein